MGLHFVLDWVATSAQAVAYYDGRFLVPHVRIRIAPVSGARARWSCTGKLMTAKVFTCSIRERARHTRGAFQRTIARTNGRSHLKGEYT